MRVLITGGSGFIGRHLAERAIELGHEVVATYLLPAELERILPSLSRVQWEPLDLRDSARVDKLVDATRADAVFHLGAQAYAARAWKDPAETFETNVLGTVHLYEALRRHPPREGVFLASSAAAYGTVDRLPTDEDAPLRPVNPYGVSKACQDMLSLQYSVNFDLRIVRGRLFITTGPGKTGDALNDFAQRVAQLERQGRPGKLRVGNLDVRRDISDVRDVVRAIWVVFERGDPRQPINIGAGESFSVRTIAESLLRRSRVPLTLESDPTLLRPTDEPDIRSDITRLRALGYTPTIPLDRTIEDSLNHWREFPTV
ncbi:MAG TPA: GDP-mannose 4,6-dehydratase [Thermoplasmata archaeon]|nr:GDP-mannose 4,6-dehydratase [Thermoplasmata archaeon]